MKNDKIKIKKRCGATRFICFGLSCVVFVSSAGKLCLEDQCKGSRRCVCVGGGGGGEGVL